MRKLKVGLLAGVVALATTGAWASGFFTNGVPLAGGTQYPLTIPLTGNEQIPADTELSSGANPQSEAITVGQLGLAAATTNPRNYLLNGDMQVDQMGTGIVTGGTTSITQAAMAADRWFISTNVTSGAGRGQVTTSVPLPPTGFINSLRVYRTSGALTQQVCAAQEIETARATQLAGRNVVLSGYLTALAGMVADNGGVVNAYVITGTGSDQGLGTLTASPAITPAWTGIAGGASPAATWTISTTTTRYATPAVVAIPATATEVGVEICFTPTASGSGTTDGFAMTGVQLEPVLGTNATNPGPSAFEFRNYQTELTDAQRFVARFLEANYPSGSAMNGFCQATGASTNTCSLNLPVTMRGTTPTITITTAGTFKVNIAGTATTFSTPTAGVCSVVACTVTGANTNTAGQAEQMTSGAGSGDWLVASDVVM